LSLSVAPKSADRNGGQGNAPPAGFLSLPSRPGSPLAAVARRLLLAVGLLVLTIFNFGS